jgi:hypothetical protein
VHQKYSRSEYKCVPDGLTIAQAAEMKKKTVAKAITSHLI